MHIPTSPDSPCMAGRRRATPSPGDACGPTPLPCVGSSEPPTSGMPHVRCDRVIVNAISEQPCAAMDRLKLLQAVLRESGLIGNVTLVNGYPVLFITNPRAPWGVSVGEVNFWLGDPPEVLCPNDRVLEAAWSIAGRLRHRPAHSPVDNTTMPFKGVAPA